MPCSIAATASAATPTTPSPSTVPTAPSSAPPPPDRSGPHPANIRSGLMQRAQPPRGRMGAQFFTLATGPAVAGPALYAIRRWIIQCLVLRAGLAVLFLALF